MIDIQEVLTPAFAYLKWLIPLFILAGTFKSAWFKGKFGEFIVNHRLKKSFDSDIYTLLKDITVAPNKVTTQIDHILVSQFGIFVIETKNFKGWIFGNENQKTWTQKIYKKSYKFQNPLHQNFKHLKTLEEMLSLPSTMFHSLVIFSGEATFKTKMPENITQLKQAIKFIKSKEAILLANEEVETAIQTIKRLSLKKGLKTDIKHVKNLKSRHSPKQAGNNCSKCGSSLTVRTIKRGSNIGSQFLGCSNFPKCRYTQQIE